MLEISGVIEEFGELTLVTFSGDGLTILRCDGKLQEIQMKLLSLCLFLLTKLRVDFLSLLLYYFQSQS